MWLADAISSLGYFRHMRATPPDQFVKPSVERNLSLKAELESRSFGRADTIPYKGRFAAWGELNRLV